MLDKDSMSKNYLEEHRRQYLEAFRWPAIEEFARAYRCPLPPSLHRLYELRETLLCVPFSLKVNDRTFVIQGFTPLSPALIAVGVQQYGRKFVAFAYGDEGEGYLLSIEDSNQLHIDYDGDGRDIEMLDTGGNAFIEAIIKKIQS